MDRVESMQIGVDIEDKMRREYDALFDEAEKIRIERDALRGLCLIYRKKLYAVREDILTGTEDPDEIYEFLDAHKHDAVLQPNICREP